MRQLLANNIARHMNIQLGCLILFMAVFFTGNALAQSGKITGTLLDAETNEPLIGATVGIQGTTKGAITDIDGTISC